MTVRLTTQVLHLLAVMLEEPEGEWYGLELFRVTGIKPGTGYPILQRLLRAEWVERREEPIDPRVEGRPARALYRFTPGGRLHAEDAVKGHLTSLAQKGRLKKARVQPA